MRALIIAVAAAVPMSALGALTGEGRTKKLIAARAERPPAIDGVLDDAAWLAANPASDFTQFYPEENQPPTEATEVRVAYDSTNLYVGIRLFDRSPGEIVRRLARRDRDVESDSVAVAIDAFHDHRTARAFQVNAAGVNLDALLYDDSEASIEWDVVWDARVSVDERGWSAEMAIPLRALRYHAEPDAVWGFQVQRYVSRRKERDLWAMVPRSSNSGVSGFGHLLGLKDVAPVRDLELLPYAAAKGGANSGQPVWGATAGVDLRYGVSADLSLDVTANPDFGQVEADPSVLNLGTFETFYPEKRPFFLEGADLFQPPWRFADVPVMQLFYSRRVGRAPPEPLLADGESVASSAVAIPIAAAAKLAGQVAPGWTVAAVDAFTTGAAATVDATARGGGYGETRELAAPTNFGVLRLRRDLKNGFVGGTFTAATPVQGPRDTCDIDAEPSEGRCYRGSEAAAVDWRWRPSSNTLVSGQLVGSHVSAGPSRQNPDGTRIAPGDAGLGGQVRFAKDGGEHWLFRLDGDFATPNLDLNDAGFLRRQNYQRIQTAAILRSTKPVLFLREGSASLAARTQLGNRGVTTMRELELNVEMGLRNFWWTGFGGLVGSETMDDRELRDGPAIWRPPAVAGWVWLNSDGRKAVSLAASAFGWQGLDDRLGAGHGAGADARLAVRPVSRYDVELSFKFERHFEAAKFIEALPEGYRLAPLETRFASLTLRQSLALTPRLTLQTYTQLFFASARGRGEWRAPLGENVLPGTPVELGAEDWPYFHAGTLNLTAVLRWEFSPGSSVYLVYTRSQSQAAEAEGYSGIAPLRDLAALGQGPANDIAMVKLAYWFGV